jgi:hypothetical protein
MGSVLGTVVAEQIKTGVGTLEPEQQAVAAQTLGSGTIPTISALPDYLRVVVESAYGTGVGNVFLVAVPLAIVTLIAVIFLPNSDLGTLSAVQRAKAEAPHHREVEDAEDAAIDAATASVALAPVGLAHPDGDRAGDGERAGADRGPGRSAGSRDE